MDQTELTLGTSRLYQFFSRICYLAVPLFLPYYAQLCRQKNVSYYYTDVIHESEELFSGYYIVPLGTILCSPLECYFALVQVLLENTLSEAAEEGCTKSDFLAAPLQFGSAVSLSFHHWQMSGGFTPLALAR